MKARVWRYILFYFQDEYINVFPYFHVPMIVKSKDKRTKYSSRNCDYYTSTRRKWNQDILL